MDYVPMKMPMLTLLLFIISCQVLKPVMPSNCGAVQRFHNLVYLHQDGSADHMEYIPTCRGASAKRAHYDHIQRRFFEERHHQPFSIKHSYSTNPLLVVAGNTSEGAFGRSKNSRDDAIQINETPISLDFMSDESLGRSLSSSSSANTTVPFNQTERQKPGNLHSNNHFSSGSVKKKRILTLNSQKSRPWKTAAECNASHRASCDNVEYQKTLSNRNSSSNIHVKSTVASASSTESSMVVSDLRKMVSRSQAEKNLHVLSSSHKGNVIGKSRSERTHLLDVTSNLLSSRGSIPHPHHQHPREPDLVDVSCSCLPDEGFGLQRNTAQIHEMNMFSRDQSHRRSDRCKNYVKSQASITPFREKHSSFTSRQPRQMQQESYLWRKSRNQLRQSFKRVTSGESKLTNTPSFQMSRLGNGLQTKPRTEHGHRNQFLPRKSQLPNPSSIFGIGQERIGLFAENKQEKCQLTNKFPLKGVNVTKQSQFSERKQNLHDRISLPERQLTITSPNPLLVQEMTSSHGGTADLHNSSRYSPSSSLGRSVRSQNEISTSSNEPVENFALPHELTSRKIRTLITNQILSESVEQRNSRSSIPRS